MAGLTLIAAPEERFDTIRSVLQDWAAAGTIGPFAWSHTGDPAQEMVRCDDAGAVAARLDHMAATERVDEVLVIDLTSIARDPDVGRSFAEAVEAAFPVARIIRARAVFVGTAETARTEKVAVPGFHTVLLAPEDGAAPDKTGVAVPSLAAGVTAIAATLAGVAGLWPQQDGSPLRTEQAPNTAHLRLARAYHRALDSSAVEARLRAALLEVTGGLPLPTDAGMTALPVEDTGLAAGEMADALWRRHADLLRGPRLAVPRSTAKAIGPLEAIKMFFGFLGATLRNAPRRWLTATLTRAKATTARALQNAIFGQGASSFEIMVAGVTRDGMPASWHEQREAAERIAQALDELGGDEHHTRIDPSRLWGDFADAVLTLADAGERAQGLPPIRLNGRRGVIAVPEQIVPGPGQRFTDAPPALAAAIGDAEVDAVDLLEARRLSATLAKAEEDPSTSRLAAACRNDLNEWGRRHGDAFAVRVGRTLASAFSSVNTELAAILQRLHDASSVEEAGDRLEKHQRRLARTLRIIAAVFAGIVVVIVVLLITAVLGWLATVLWVLGAIVVWLVTSMITFVRGQAELFRILNERENLRSKQAADEANLREALRDLRRLGDLYEQFLLWSRALGAVLERPFGSAVDDLVAAPPLADLPRSVVLGRLVPGEDIVRRVAADLRRELFTDGWLGPVWEATLAQAGELLGARAGELGGRPETLFADTGRPEGLLTTWVAAFEAAGVPPRSGDVYWNQALEALRRSDHAAPLSMLREHVQTGGSADSSPLVDFASGLSEGHRTASVPFNSVLLSPIAVMQGRGAVADESRTGADDGLGGAWTFVQWSAPLAETDVALFDVPQVPRRSSRTAPGAAVSAPVSTPTPTIDPVRAPFGGAGF